jgi:membrane protein
MGRQTREPVATPGAAPESGSTDTATPGSQPSPPSGTQPPPSSDGVAPVVGRRPSKRFMTGKAVRKFFADECWDRAAGMTFFGALSIPPLAVALASVLALAGQDKAAVTAVLDVLHLLAPDEESLEAVSRPVLALMAHPSAGLSLVVGLVTALWLAAGYVGSFGRAMNHIYGVHEGRPLWRLQAWHLLTTVVLVAFGVLVALLLVVSGPVARAVGTVLGVGSTALLVWEVLRWPVLLVAAAVVVALLYYATPNVRHPRFRWMSTGALVALGVAVAATLLLRLYATSGRFDLTYGGVLAGVVVFCLWLWVINMALLMGAELDTEIHRARQLVAGVREAEHKVHLPVRDSRATERARRRQAADAARARSLRHSHGWRDDEPERREETKP